MAIAANPEIISPRRTGAGWGGRLDDAHLDLLAHLLDDFLRIPGTPIRFGLDGIIGFFPGVGDILGGLASSILILVAWRRGIAKITVARMVLNVAIETGVGALPFVGNLFDIGWRANRRNYALLTGASAEPGRHKAGSWLFVAVVCLVLVALMVLPMLFFGWLLVHVKGWLHGI